MKLMLSFPDETRTFLNSITLDSENTNSNKTWINHTMKTSKRSLLNMETRRNSRSSNKATAVW